MNKISIVATSLVTKAELGSARLGQRFRRLDLQSQLALLATASLEINFDEFARDRVGICLAAGTGSLSSDVNFWNGRREAGGPSPTLFAYTLPSAAIGEIAIHFRLTGPNLCFIGDNKILLAEAVDLIHRGEADGCVCVCCETVSTELAEIIAAPAAATACALFLKRGPGRREVTEFDRDIKAIIALISTAKSVS